MTIWTQLAIAFLMTMVTFLVWIGGIKTMASVGLDAWRRVGEKPQALFTLLVVALPVFVAPLLAGMLVNAVDAAISFSVLRAALWFGALLLALWGALSVLPLIGLTERMVARAAIVGVFVAALVSSFVAAASNPLDRIGAPQNNKMQQTSHG